MCLNVITVSVHVYFILLGGAGVTQEALKARLKLKATRTSTATRLKQESVAIKEEGEIQNILALMWHPEY